MFDYKQALVDAGVPEELHQEAIKSLLISRSLFYPKILLYKLSAPFMALLFTPFMKWEDNKVPKFFDSWDNNISCNGDATNWRYVTVDGVTFPKRDEAPLEIDGRFNDAGRPLCYYRKGNPHVREFLSRLTWLGFRNPAGKSALNAGPMVNGLNSQDAEGKWKFNIDSWGHENPQRKDLGVKVLRLGSHWQIIRFAHWKTFTIPQLNFTLNLKWLGIKEALRIGGWSITFGKDTNMGYKVRNVASDYDPRDPDARLCVCHTSVPFIIKK